MKAYHLMERLAWLDRVATSVRDTAKQRSGGASKSLSKQLHEAETLMDSLHYKMVVVKEGKVIAEERLREKIGFIYGSVMSYKGRPTESQESGLVSLAKDVDKINSQISAFKEIELPELNKNLVKSGKKEITTITEEDFLKEKEGK